MAIIIGGVAASHTPTIGFAFDRDKRSDPVWAPIFTAFDPMRAWLEAQKPDVLFIIYNDHVTSFFFDHYSAFTLGVGGRWEVADEGGGARALPAIEGDPAFAAHIGRSLMADEFDMAFFQKRPLDHGCFSPLSMLCRHDTGWPARVVPLQVGVLQFPTPTARRCWRLGQALRRAIESYPSRCGLSSSPPAVSRTRCTANAPDSTTRSGMRASSTCSRTILSGSPR
jgi:gallate dioxygenase